MTPKQYRDRAMLCLHLFGFSNIDIIAMDRGDVLKDGIIIGDMPIKLPESAMSIVHEWLAVHRGWAEPKDPFVTSLDVSSNACRIGTASFSTIMRRMLANKMFVFKLIKEIANG